MKKLTLIVVLYLFHIVTAHADIPKAELTLTGINSEQWPAEYRLTLNVPVNHHAYLDSGDENIYISVAIDPNNTLQASGLQIAHLTKPKGRYEPEVRATVLRGSGEFNLLVALNGRKPGRPTVPLEVRYQLCNDITHVCFRPQTTAVDLRLPAASAANPLSEGRVSDTPDDTASITDRLLSLFVDSQDNTLIMFCLMFLAGILSVATPCVYPMLPITSMFIVNRANGEAEKEKLHAMAYVVGIIGTYIVLGLAAGMTGGAFNTFMQSAWVNIGFAVFFAFFAVSLLGFYELAFMQNEVNSLDQHSAKVKGLTGTWLMGSVAGLVISPCVGPIVFALLLQIADNIAEKAMALASIGQRLSFWDKLGVASQGGVMMGGFGLGVGLPFFVISVVKFKLPKAGYWMNKIKYAFGLMILYFAYAYFAKGMGVLGVETDVTLMLAVGMLAVWIAVVHCNVLTLLPADAQPNRKMHHYCGVMSLILGAWLTVAGMAQTPIAAAESKRNTVAVDGREKSVVAVQEDAGISWHRQFEAAQKVAQQSGKPIFIDFYASWCANCVAFKKETADNSELNRVLRENAVAVKLVDKEPEFEKFRERPEHRQLKIGLPYFAIVSPDGKLLWSTTDYKATEKMVAILSSTNPG
ncbi:protein-disulfide reductase DsbD family protein [Methylomonas methanica]|uniref:Protein-disulfide reductase n=1 Tax=Methylomonas methanica (strain DSM 25384 / MC09) TaxID=857087 RepID=F9ZYS7_METMM|nr:cytochrome c biogenesis protein CcdA [Methylomonas methanica]AEF98623.1 Protein-disulfide reductase [Methylomonas methanica MC09]